MARVQNISDIVNNPTYCMYVNPFDALFFAMNQRLVENLYQAVIFSDLDDIGKNEEEFRTMFLQYQQVIDGYRQKIDIYGKLIKEHLNKTEDSAKGDRDFKNDEVVKNAIRAREDDKEKSREMAEKIIKQLEDNLYKISADAYATHFQDKKVRDILVENRKDVSINSFILTQAMMATKYLGWMIKCKDGKLEESHEICFANGEIVTVTPGGLKTNNPVSSLESIEEKLIRVVLTANRLFQTDKSIKNKPISISGRYLERGSTGQNRTEPVKFSSTQLRDFAKSSDLLSFISPDMFKKLSKDGLIRKDIILKAIERKLINPNTSIDYYRAGIITEREFLDSLKAKDFKAVANDKRLSLKGKFFLYAFSKIKMEELKAYIKKNPDEEKPDLKFMEELVPYFSINPKKLGELLVNDVLDYDVAIEYLDVLEEHSAIRTVAKPGLIDLLNDFRVDELDNISCDELIVGEGRGNYSPKKKGLTIDPELRMGYLKSIGNVKQIAIKGNPLMKDEDPEAQRKNNSLDGYQLIILPDKKVAVLEKFFETTRDKEGNVTYRRDKNGNRIPAIENATYIIPIGKAREFSTKKNKKELIESPYVHRVFHKANWVGELESKIQLINEKAEFEQENTDRWAELIKNNYEELFENR